MLSLLVALCIVICAVPTVVFAESAQLTDNLDSVEEISIPTAFDVVFKDEPIFSIDEFNGDVNNLNVRRVKAMLNKDDKVLIKSVFDAVEDAVENTDSQIIVYMENGDIIGRYDDNNAYGNGEIVVFTAPESRTYYFAFASGCYNDGKCKVSFEKIDASNSFDFSAQYVPVPGSGDLWSWNSSTKTLTLKDGFSIMNYGIYDSEKSCDAIILPDGSTVVIEGNAKITSLYGYAINAKGKLTVKGSDKSVSKLENESFGGIYINKGLTVENCTLKTSDFYSSLFCVDGDISVNNCVLDIVTQKNAIYLQSMEGLLSDEVLEGRRAFSILLENTVAKIKSNESAVFNSTPGNTKINNSDIYIDSRFSGIMNDEGNVEVNGGRLRINTDYYSAISAENVILKDLLLDIKTCDEEVSLITMFNAEGFNIPGSLRFYDREGNLVREGSWKDEYIVGEENYIIIDNERICRIVTVHEHTYGDWSSDAENHWHQCTNGYCDDLDGSVKDKAAHTGSDDGDCTTPVLCDVCGYVIKAAEKSHKYGEWKDNGNGTRSRYCTNDGCKASQTEKYTVNKDDEKHYVKSPKTGEADGAAVTVTLIASGIALLAGVAFLGGKKIKNK